MISQQQLKIYSSLHQKKYRKVHGLFIAEGIKLVFDLINSEITTHKILYNKDLSDNYKIKKLPSSVKEECHKNVLNKISNLKTPPNIIGIFHMPAISLNIEEIEKDLVIVLDGIQDPGNMGTLIRIADWFGIKHILCNESCVDIYNTKVVQATMGSISRVHVHYTNLEHVLYNTTNAIYGTHLKGNNIYNTNLEKKKAYIIFGSEGSGISENIEKVITQKLFIPPYPSEKKQIDSLNISVSAGIVLSEFRK